MAVSVSSKVFNTRTAWSYRAREVSGALEGAVCLGLEILTLGHGIHSGRARATSAKASLVFLIYGVLALQTKRRLKLAPCWSKLGNANPQGRAEPPDGS